MLRKWYMVCVSKRSSMGALRVTRKRANCFLVCMSFVDNTTLAQLGQEPEVAKRKRAKAA